MPAHTRQEFNLFMSQLKETNVRLDFYCDFNKISGNVANIAISLHMLNYLIGKKDLRSAVEDIWNRDPSAFDVMDILIATRKHDNKKFLDNNGECKLVHSLFSSVDGIMKYLNETGLDVVLQRPEINNLVDYVFGVETGLDTNARKNRSGNITESNISRLLISNGLVFEEQVSSNQFPDITRSLGTDQKVFDFAIYTNDTTYLIEVNFYSGGGSKLNEVARSYTELAPKINGIEGFEFVWITDGIGWHSAKNKLEEAFYAIPRVYNLTSVQYFIESLRTM